MSGPGPSLVYRRLRAPVENGGVLIEPPLVGAENIRKANATALAAARIELGGRSLTAWRMEAQRQLVVAALAYTREYRDVPDPPGTDRIWMAGHQPHLFHPGVWLKNFVLGQLAARHEGVAVNLIVDNDLIREAAIRVPTGDATAPTVETIHFDAERPDIPYEERTVHDQELLASFGERAASGMSQLVADPILREFWPLVAARGKATGNLGAALSQGRHAWEGNWGLNTLELPLSRVCQLPAWSMFVAHILEHAAQFREIHNGALAEYRQIHRLRSPAQPVPDLICEDDWLEMPFWVWRADDPRRKRLFVRDRLVLSDRSGWEVRLPCPDCLGNLMHLAAQGIKIRPRAITTTMFARFLLSDLFVHGIGGAKYDQIGDLILVRFFQVAPPTIMIVTGTLPLPIEQRRIMGDDLRRADDALRTFVYHPEKFVSQVSNGEQLAAEVALRDKRAWIATPATAENARTRCRAIRAANDRLVEQLASVHQRLAADRNALQGGLRRSAILFSREYAFCLHPGRTLLPFLQTEPLPSA